MQEGFTLATRGGQFRPEVWIEGPPERSFVGVVKTKGRQVFEVVAYRCEACGLLKFMAQKKAR